MSGEGRGAIPGKEGRTPKKEGQALFLSDYVN